LRLAFFDVDGTLKQERDPYMYLHRQLGTEGKGVANLNAFLAGEFDYDTFAQRDAELWAGLETVQIDTLCAAIPYIPEARTLAERLQAAGVRVVLISTGIDRHVRQVADDLDASDWICNELLVEDGRLTGRMYVRVYWNSKGMHVRDYMARHGVGGDECLAVGDSEGDLSMFVEVGHRIAVNPSDDSVRAAADLVLGEGDIEAWLSEHGIEG
jgi:phosphoserine phosphatase